MERPYLGGAAYRMPDDVAVQPQVIMYPEFVLYKGAYFEFVSMNDGTLRYESLRGDVILGRPEFPGMYVIYC